MPRIRSMVVALALAILGPAGMAAAAPPGTPDPAFGHHGVVSVATARGFFASGQVLVPAGKGILALGTRDVVGLNGDEPPEPELTGRVLAADGTPEAALATRPPGIVSGAVLDRSRNRIVVALSFSLFPIDLSYSVTLAAFHPDGTPDPTFGQDGTMDLAEPAGAARLLQAPDGTLLVVGERFPTGPPANGSPDGVLLARVSRDGHELGARVIPSPAGSLTTVDGAVKLPGGATLVVGTITPARRSFASLFLARFTAAGTPDPSFGGGGLVGPGLDHVLIEDAARDARGRILVAGARTAVLPGDTDEAVAEPLLVRLRANGTVDPAFTPPGYALGGDEVDFTGVHATAAGTIYVAGADGRVGRFGAKGRPDLRFGVGGLSVLPAGAPREGAGLTLVGGTALVTGGRVRAGGGTDLAVERVLLHGAGVVAPRAGSRVQVVPLAGRVSVRTELDHAAQRIHGAVAVALADFTGGPPASGEPFLLPIPTSVGAVHGGARVRGRGGFADVRHGGFSLQRARGRVAAIDLDATRCPAVRVTSVRLAGRFVVHAGLKVIRNRTRRATIRVRQRCAGPVQVRVLRGRVTVTRRAR